MTARQVFEATLVELSKIQAPSLKLYEFNYYFNKAINQYINKVYNIYDVNQQTTDDLRVLKSTAYLTPQKVFASNNALMGTNSKHTGIASSYLSKAHTSIQSLHGATYEVFMPMDYLHMLNCVCIYYVAKQKDCWDEGSYIEVPATRLTADSWSQIITDIYNRPSPMRPYYYIHNVNQYNTLPTNPVKDPKKDGTQVGTDINGVYKVTSSKGEEGDNSNFQRNFQLNSYSSNGEVSQIEASLVEKNAALRIGNASNVRCEIRYGKDDSLFQLAEVQIDYVKCPQFIRLTQDQIDLTEDTSQIMEFPDYVNQEIINELVHLVMERVNDPRLSNNLQMTQSIARPTEQQQQSN